MASKQFDIRLIPEFSGAATDTPIMEWLEALELTCELCEITQVERVLPLRLKGVARERYRQLSKEQRDDVEEIKRGLIKAYGTDSFVAFEQFTTRRLRPERLQNGAPVLGWTVREEGKMLIWERGNEVPSVPQVRTRRSMFSFCGKLVGHFPVVKWIGVAAAFIKRRATDITKGWNDEVTDVPLTTMITEVVARVRQEDPVRGKWCVDGPELDVWVDASSLATGVSLEHDGAAVEDASSSWKERDTQHINMAELDAVLKGINMALMQEATILHIHTDSACVHKWITDTLTEKARVCTRAASEMLIRRPLDTLASLVKGVRTVCGRSPSEVRT